MKVERICDLYLGLVRSKPKSIREIKEHEKKKRLKKKKENKFKGISLTSNFKFGKFRGRKALEMKCKLQKD